MKRKERLWSSFTHKKNIWNLMNTTQIAMVKAFNNWSTNCNGFRRGWRPFLSSQWGCMVMTKVFSQAPTQPGSILALVYSRRWTQLWCNGYLRKKSTRRHEFKSLTRLIAFHIALIPLGKVWIQLFSLQLWLNSRTDLVLQPWLGN